MAIKQEQVVFAVTAALLGWWVSGDLSQGSTRGRSRGGSRAPELEAFPAPDPALALAARDDLERLPRDLFTPPRDTAPLPPLGLRRRPSLLWTRSGRRRRGPSGSPPTPSCCGPRWSPCPRPASSRPS